MLRLPKPHNNHFTYIEIDIKTKNKIRDGHDAGNIMIVTIIKATKPTILITAVIDQTEFLIFTMDKMHQIPNVNTEKAQM